MQQNLAEVLFKTTEHNFCKGLKKRKFAIRDKPDLTEQ